MPRIHGANLSLGYEFDAEMFACGQSPLCAEVDRLVQSGVVVVAAAGNTGYGTASSISRSTRIGMSNSINDPGNAARAITVGATHREFALPLGQALPRGRKAASTTAIAAYTDDSGTSMAAPHVSGAIAAFLSIRREFIGKPDEIKRVFLDSATSLGRERYFEGHGLVDLMRAIQSI
jgi:subtilisin family serine protease